MRNFIIISICVLLAFPAASQQTKILTAEKHNEYGLVYSLPTTALDVEIIAVKETQKAGPYYKYANKFVGDNKVITADREIWTIEEINVTPYGIPDAEKRYVMQLKPGALTYIGVDDNGMLLSINTDPEPVKKQASSFETLIGQKSTGKEYLDFVNEDFVAAQSSFKQAQILAEELMEVRDAKLSLTRGTADVMPTDGQQLRIMLDELDRQEKAFAQAFTGASWKERKAFKFTFVPKEEGQSLLCYLDPQAGPVRNNGKNFMPVTIDVNMVAEAEMPKDGKGEPKKLHKDAVMYNVPGTANITVALGKNTLFSEDFELSQFGLTFGLSPSIFTDKKEPSSATFNPATGALLEVKTIKP